MSVTAFVTGTTRHTVNSSVSSRQGKEKKRKVYAVRRYNGSFCTQKQPETAAFRALKAATRKGKQKDPKGGQQGKHCL